MLNPLSYIFSYKYKIFQYNHNDALGRISYGVARHLMFLGMIRIDTDYSDFRSLECFDPKVYVWCLTKSKSTAKERHLNLTQKYEKKDPTITYINVND